MKVLVTGECELLSSLPLSAYPQDPQGSPWQLRGLQLDFQVLHIFTSMTDPKSLKYVQRKVEQA